MPRQLKPYTVDSVTRPETRERLDIYFDRNRKLFFAAIGMERVEHTDLKEAKKLALELLTRAPKYDWQPIIVVRRVARESGDHYAQGFEAEHADLDISFYRCERASSPIDPDVVYAREHTIDFEQSVRDHTHWKGKEEVEHDRQRMRQERDDNKRLDKFYDSDDHAVLPYTDETWEGLLVIKRAVDQTRTSLHALIERDNLAEQLRSIAGRTLPPLLEAHEPKKRKVAR